jgi:hypothetical protein
LGRKTYDPFPVWNEVETKVMAGWALTNAQKNDDAGALLLFHHPIHRRVLAVLHLDPVLGAASSS